MPQALNFAVSDRPLSNHVPLCWNIMVLGLRLQFDIRDGISPLWHCFYGTFGSDLNVTT